MDEGEIVVGGFLFTDKGSSAEDHPQPFRLVGGEKAAHTSSMTLIEVKGGRLVYGAEIPCEIWDREHDVPRSAGRTIRLCRKEFRVPEDRKGPIGRGWTFVVAHLPPTQRRVAMAKIQSRIINRQGARFLDDVPAVAMRGDSATLSDQELVQRLEELDENVFETGRYWVASLPYGLRRQGSFTPYGIATGDARMRERWATAALRAGTAKYAYGAFEGCYESIRRTLREDGEYQALRETRHVRSPRTEDGMRVNKRIILCDNVLAHIDVELDLATRQALGGWGCEAEKYEGKPVVERIRRLFDRALEALHKRERRYFVGEARSGYDFWPSDGQIGDVEDRLIESIDRRRAESGR